MLFYEYLLFFPHSPHKKSKNTVQAYRVIQKKPHTHKRKKPNRFCGFHITPAIKRDNENQMPGQSIFYSLYHARIPQETHLDFAKC